MITARDAAFSALKNVANGAYSSIALDAVLNSTSLSERDKAFATALFYGVLEKEKLLDHLIKICLSKPNQRIKPDVRLILRMGIYQLGFMDKVPDNAAVDQSVTLAKKHGQYKLSGFVNAVLHAYIRKGKPTAASIENNAVNSAVEFSCPQWLIKLWCDAYGNDICQGILKSMDGRAPIYARVNNVLCKQDALVDALDKCNVAATEVKWLSNALELKNTRDIEKLQPFRTGWFHVQDIASQLCCMALEPQPGERILDVCSAPGGKAFTIAELMGDNGEVIACDLYPKRVELIAKGAARLGLKSIAPLMRDALDPSDNIVADRVLCDAPCSGLGVIRRKPDIKNKAPQELSQLPDLQYRILCSASESVKEGGVLVYSTCTLNPCENQGVVERFLEEHSSFEPYPFGFPAEVAGVIEEPAYCRTLFPHIAGSDGFFIARLRKK